jgi:hypothetical protein
VIGQWGKVRRSCPINGSLFKYMDELSRKGSLFFVRVFVAFFVHLTLRGGKKRFLFFEKCLWFSHEFKDRFIYDIRVSVFMFLLYGQGMKNDEDVRSINCTVLESVVLQGVLVLRPGRSINCTVLESVFLE